MGCHLIIVKDDWKKISIYENGHNLGQTVEDKKLAISRQNFAYLKKYHEIGQDPKNPFSSSLGPKWN